MVDFLRSVERLSRLIRMYLIFSLMFIALTTILYGAIVSSHIGIPPRERLRPIVYWEINERQKLF